MRPNKFHTRRVHALRMADANYQPHEDVTTRVGFRNLEPRFRFGPWSLCLRSAAMVGPVRADKNNLHSRIARCV